MRHCKLDASHQDWVWPDAEKDVNFSSYASVDNDHNDLATRGIFSIDELCDDQEGGSSSGEKRDMNLTLN
jgi:hypothetical protein